MDLSSSHQVPRGPMTRARARALETEVTSLLNELPYESCETWLLPQTEMLCMLRYLEDPSEDVREDGQVPKFTDEEERRTELEKPQVPDIRPQAPDIRPLEHLAAAAVRPTSYRARTSGRPPDIRPDGPENPAPPPDIRRPVIEHPEERPQTARTSGASPDI